jgi:GntR family transcriptional regulator / MocR family aminotransferase
MGSASKTLAPALRLRWMVLPGDLAGLLAEERGWADGGSPVLDQLALAAFIERGELDRHLRRMRLRYRWRRDALIAAVERALPELAVTGAAAGLHITLALPEGADAEAIVERAEARGVAILGCAPGLLFVGYANIADTAIGPAVAALADAARAAH